MPVEAKPLFRPDVLRPHIEAFSLPNRVDAFRPKLAEWAELLRTGGADAHKETALLPAFLSDLFCGLLGYTEPTAGENYTLEREKLVEVGGKFADAVLGRFAPGVSRPVVALEGKGPKDPLDRPHAGRKMSAVDQAYRYAINLPCDWIIVTNMRQTRLYGKATDQQTYERFDTEALAADERQLRRFLFLLGAERIIPADGACHLYGLRAASEQVGKELTKKYYVAYADIRQDVFEQLAAANPTEPRDAVLSAAQKLLDRVLFVAFSEDRGLLPPDSLKKAHQHRDPYHPRPVWENFRGLFRSVNEGNAALGIPLYNGGLFADDATLDRLAVPDAVCRHFDALGDFDYRPAADAAADLEGDEGRLIDVDILGHIFEQSITDLEKLKDEIEGRSMPLGKEKHKTRRKKEGAFYTPAFITRYIVEQTLGAMLADRFDRLRLRHETAAVKTAVKVLADPRVYDLPALNGPQRAALVTFWEAWQDELAAVRILDPSCGSGAFLIEAFDQLHATYLASNDRLEELRGHRTLFDLDRQILQNNLYGVDLNGEAIEICKLSLWIKTAARGKVLTSLDHSIRVGNSVVDEPAVHPRAFDWRAAFPEVFDAGGFDAVVGNPPYIRQEWLAPYKPYWQQQFASYHGTADIFVYFYELGVSLLRDGGRLGFITSGSWIFSGFGAGLRHFISENSRIESIVDFGEYQPFEKAEMIRPTIMVTRNSARGGKLKLFKWLTEGSPPENLTEVIDAAPSLSTTHLGRTSWELEPDDVRRLRAKVLGKHSLLENYCKGMFFAGIKTGRNEAFIIDPATRDRLIAEHPSSADVIKPFIMGTDVQNWHLVERERYIIFTKHGIDISRYPAIRAHLENYRSILTPKNAVGDRGPGRKPGPYQWYEIQDATAFNLHFHSPKIIWPDIAKLPRFVLDRSEAYLDMTCFMIPSDDAYLLGVLSSWVTWFLISKTCQPLRLRGGRWQYRLKKQWLSKLPIPNGTEPHRIAIGSAAIRCNEIGQERYRLQKHLRTRIVRTFGSGKTSSPDTLNRQASSWWACSLMQLGGAIEKSFKLNGNPFANPRTADEWEPYIAEKRQELARLTAALADAEAELNERVYRLFDLTAEEIRLLKKEVEH